MNPQINPNVPIIGSTDQPVMLPVIVQITPDLKEKLAALVKERGIDGATLVSEIVSRGLASIYRECGNKAALSALPVRSDTPALR
jgi:hypothetical protein